VKDWVIFADPLLVAPGSVIAIAFLALWRREPGRRHHLWWGLAASLLVASAAAFGTGFTVGAESTWNVVITSWSVQLGAVGYWIGARDYAGRPLSAGGLRFVLGATLALLVVIGLLPPVAAAVLFDLTVAAAFAAVAALLWPLGGAERLAAALMLGRAVNGALLTRLIDGYEMTERFRLNQTLYFAAGLLLIVGGFLRSGAELRALRGNLAARVAQGTAALQQAQQELAAANTELEAFTYGVSHDLRAPLRTLEGYSRMLEEDCAEALDQAACGQLEELRAIARGVGVLVDDLLRFSRLLRKDPTPEPLDLAVVFDTAVADFCRERELALESAVAPRGLGAYADRALAGALLWLAVAHLVPLPVGTVGVALELGAVPARGPGVFALRVRGVPQSSLRGAAAASRELSGALLARLLAHCGGALWIEREGEQAEAVLFRLPEAP
jgi:signal transduction histidine kinase